MQTGISGKDLVDVGDQKCSSSVIHIPTKEAVVFQSAVCWATLWGSADRGALVAATNAHKLGMLGLSWFPFITCNGPEQRAGREIAIKS